MLKTIQVRQFYGALGSVLLLAPAAIFILLWFFLPLSKLFLISFSDPRGAAAAYAEILNDTVYRHVLTNTIILAFNVTVISVVLAYPVAYVLTRLKGMWLYLASWCVLVPFWISVLVRTFSWMLLLERNGPINELIQAVGLRKNPFDLLFNTLSVHIGMVHVLLPYAVLPLYAALARIDRRLLQASDGLGASPWVTFVRVYLPLSFRGIAAGATLVFLLSLGAFITPAILGGANSTTLSMLIEDLVEARLAWPLAAAASFILLGGTLLAFVVAARLMPFRQMMAVR